MSLNQFMHPRNRYKDKKPDFEALAAKYPLFKQHTSINEKGKTFIDFKDAEALRALTITLLAEDFDLTVELPRNRLTPTVPLRLNYLHWLEDVLGQGSSLIGLDIGTGPCCVYPMLGCRLNPWSFLATESDETAFQFAKANVEKNNLQDRIEVMLVKGDNLLQESVEADGRSFDFCMCNPPFFGDSLEAQGLTNCRTPNRPPALSVTSAQPQESTCPGGEINFIAHIIQESLQLKDRVRVYSSMVGKKVSLAPLKAELRRNGITNIGTTEFCQGRTMRWAIGWSLDKTVTFGKSTFQEKKKQSKARLPMQFTVPHGVAGLQYSVPDLLEHVCSILSELQIKQHKQKTGETGACLKLTAWENTWSHQRRKRREKMHTESATTPSKTAHMPDANAEGKATEPSSQESGDQAMEGGGMPEAEQPMDVEEGSTAQCQDNGQVQTEKGRDMDSDHGGPSQTGGGDASGPGEPKTKPRPPCGKGQDPKAPPLLQCWLRLKRCADDILLELEWIEGQNIETMHQILQFFKNKLVAPPTTAKAPEAESA